MNEWVSEWVVVKCKPKSINDRPFLFDGHVITSPIDLLLYCCSYITNLSSSPSPSQCPSSSWPWSWPNGAKVFRVSSWVYKHYSSTEGLPWHWCPACSVSWSSPSSSSSSLALENMSECIIIICFTKFPFETIALSISDSFFFHPISSSSFLSSSGRVWRSFRRLLFAESLWKMEETD